MSSLIGRKLGQYEVIDTLGAGGMASVFRARQESIGRYVAIKVLPPHPGRQDEFVERFKLEARTIGSLQHPHILSLYDYGQEDDIFYLVMAYADGGSLLDRMDGPMSPQQVAQVVQEIAAALDYAHRQGVVHRDIKPANILLDSSGNTLLADFGVVKMLTGGTNLTSTGIVGTPAYMSPEQGQGIPVDGRADVYALGVMAYELLVGSAPYSADTPMQTILRHINDPVPDIREAVPGLPVALSFVFQRVMAKDPEDRYQTAGEFARALDAVLRNMPDLPRAEPIKSGPPTTHVLDAPPPGQTASSETAVLRAASSPVRLLLGLAVIALLIVVVAVLLIQGNQPVDDTENPATSIAAGLEPTVTSEPLIATAAPIQDLGTVRFTTQSELGDTVTLTVRGLRPPTGDNAYIAWLKNSVTEETLAVGPVALDGFGDGVLVYTDPEGQTLPAIYNMLLISEEEDHSVQMPQGAVIYGATVPAAVADSIRAIFVSDEDGINGGSLLDGARTEARAAQQHAGLAANSTTLGGMRSHAEHTVNILRGSQDDFDGDGRPVNPGRGIGVYFFLDEINAALASAVAAPDATIDLEINAEVIRTCTQNVRLWADRVVELEGQIFEAEAMEDVSESVVESTLLMRAIMEGIDANENGQVEPFEGECGLDQIPEFGLQFARMTLLEEGDDA